MLPIVIIVLSGVSFTLMGIDKSRARKGQWRISEKALFLSAICFGAVGGTIGMFTFHHKTKHWYFRVFFPLLAVLQVGLAVLEAIYV